MNEVRDLQAEVAAIGAILEALDGLSGEARSRVLEYVADALDVPNAGSRFEDDRPKVLDARDEEPRDAKSTTPADIRSLKERKQPGSAGEMAALVAYYLAELAPPAEKKSSLGTADITRFFKQADYPLPTAPRHTLPNAAKAGYFDSAGKGQYRLNPVGYNLVAHGMPRGRTRTPSNPSPSPSSRKQRAARTGRKTPAAKKRRRSGQ